ncbi:MAG: pilus assembly protein [Azoarcus sp.]|jgi:type IV pilus assembly protein PilY1|nr:pilus assembly protein [Azoarcus sp.]
MANDTVDIAPVPLNVGNNTQPLVMLVAGKDHKLFFEAYNDATDLDGDGKLDIHFKPSIEYYGLFDSKLCYRYRNAAGKYDDAARTDTTGNEKDYFFPVGLAGADYKCTGAGQWSGNFLNYVTTSRIDALRRVLYGGYRLLDTPEKTILRRAFIPKEAHGWGKEYHSVAEDGYDIRDYTPFDLPQTGKRHFFGNFSPVKDCSSPKTCRDDFPPVLALARNAPVGKRIWDWAAAESYNLFKNRSLYPNNSDPELPNGRYAVHVQACDVPFTLPDGTEYRGGNCKAYHYIEKGVSKTAWKPVGILHKFGENDAMKFGLLTGSYDNNTSGGVLRKAMSSFGDEIDPNTGVFKYKSNASMNSIVRTFDKLMIRGWHHNGGTGTDDFKYKNLRTGSQGWDQIVIGGRVMREGEFPDWGNPVGEMMYEALRYLSGAGAPTSDYVSRGSGHDTAVGLPRPTWDKPYAGQNTTAAAKNGKAPWCAKPNLLVLSDINPSYDSDQLPGARFKGCAQYDNFGDYLTTNTDCSKPTSNVWRNSSLGSGVNSFSAYEYAHDIGDKEGINGRKHFIAQTGSTPIDWAPTAKTVDSLGSIRGLAPEEAGKEGSYYSAAVAWYGKKTGIKTDPNQANQKVDTQVVALASPIPRIEVNTSKGKLTLLPFAKNMKGVYGKTYHTNEAEGNFQPGNQIVEFYVMEMSAPGQRYHAKFRVSYEDMEAGSDFDMDAVAEYEVTEQADGTVEVKLTPTAQSAGINIGLGYVVSGAGDADGPYIVARIRDTDGPGAGTARYDWNKPHTGFYLAVPDGRPVGFCRKANISNDVHDECLNLPLCSAGEKGDFGNCKFNGKYIGRHPKKGQPLPTTSTRIFTPNPTSDAATLLESPLWYAAKWGGFRADSHDPNDWPDLQSKWDANRDGVPDAYHLVNNSNNLEGALEKALSSINTGTSSSGNVAVSAYSIQAGTLAFSTEFDGLDWRGDLVATRLTAINNSNRSGIGATVWSAAAQMPKPEDRNIYTYADNATTVARGVEFRWNSLSPSQRNDLSIGNEHNGADVLDFLRGSDAKEVSRRGAFRNRYRATSHTATGGTVQAESPLGDSANNTPLYVSDTRTVYLGANDGMLHAFDATDGRELFAYVPSMLFPTLNKLTDASYTHRYYVDGEAAVSTRQQTPDHNYLVGALGRGGKGMFGLDVTDPANFAATDVKWELRGNANCGAASNQNTAIGDNLGIVIGRPVIATLNDGVTYAIFGNGYNSCHGKATLYLVNVETGAAKQIVADSSGNNGLSTPALYEVEVGDEDETTRNIVVYAGDLKGHLWRFDLTSNDSHQWSARKMFSATNAAGKAQPITAAPTVAVEGSNETRKTWVFVGTGRYLSVSDKNDDSVQSLYGIVDDQSGINLTRNHLVARSFTSSENGGGVTRAFKSRASANDMDGKNGWRIDFDRANDKGERVVSAGIVVAAIKPVLEVPSIVPTDEDPCTQGGRGYINFVDAFSGAAVEFNFIDINGDGVVDSRDKVTDSEGRVGSMYPGLGMPGALPGLVGLQNVGGGSLGGIASQLKSLGTHNSLHGRISWREVVGS